MMQSREYQYGLVRGYLKYTNAPEWVMTALNNLINTEHTSLGSKTVTESTPAVTTPPPVMALGGGDKSPQAKHNLKSLADDGTLARWVEKVKAGKTTSEISKEEGVKEKMIQNAFTRHNISIRQLREGRSHRAKFNAYNPVATLAPVKGETTTETDGDGNTITKYPPGYAFGAAPQKSIKQS